MSSLTTNRIAKRQRGFSLVEVLIALVVMSVGMLGIAGLYVQSMQAGRTSMLRHHAVTLAGDVADRIRANQFAEGDYASGTGAGGFDHGCVVGSVVCTAAQMAANDIFVWKDQAAEMLPGGDVAVTYTAAAGAVPPTYVITVSWSEPGIITTPSYSITIPVLPI